MKNVTDFRKTVETGVDPGLVKYYVGPKQVSTSTKQMIR